MSSFCIARAIICPLPLWFRRIFPPFVPEGLAVRAKPLVVYYAGVLIQMYLLYIDTDGRRQGVGYVRRAWPCRRASTGFMVASDRGPFEGYGHGGPGVWAMARRRPKEYWRNVDAATRYSGVCAIPDLACSQMMLTGLSTDYNIEPVQRLRQGVYRVR